MPYDLQGALGSGYSDSEVAEHLAQAQGFDIAAARKEGYTDMEIAQHLGSKAPSNPTSTSPETVPYTPKYKMDLTDQFTPGGVELPGPVVYTPQQLEAAKHGVNIDAANQVSTWRANFAATKDKRDQMVADSIKQKLGPDTITRIGPDTQDVEYYDKDAKQWKVAGDSLGGMAVNAIPGAAEAAGGIAGSFTPATVAGGAVGAGIGRGLGVYAKNKVGDLLGVNEGTDPRDKPNAVAEGLKSAAITGATGAAISGLPAGLRMLLRGDDIVNSKSAQSILDSYEKNKDLVSQIDSALASSGVDKKLDLSVPRVAAIPDKTGAVNPAADRLVNREMLLNKFEPIADRERARRLNNQNVMELYWWNKVENPYAVTNLTNANWQQSLKETWDNYSESLLGPYQQRAKDAIDQAQQAAAQMKKPAGINVTRGGQIIRDAITDASKASEGVKDKAWSDYETKAQYGQNGSSDLQVPISEDVGAVQARLKYLQENLPLASQKTQASRYQLKDPDSKGSGIPLADDVSPLEQHLRQLQEGIDPDNRTMDLGALDRTIKDLREENLPTAAKDTSMSKANSKSVLGSLIKMRSAFMDAPGNEELKASLETAEAETVRHSEEFKRSFLGDFLSRSGYDSTLSDASVLDHILKNKDIDGARQLADIVRGEPGAKKAILDYTLARYNKDYTRILPDGTKILDPKRHTAFMDDVYPSIAPFLNDVDKASIKANIGGLAQRVFKTDKDYLDQISTWNSLPQGQLGKKLQGETFVNQFFDPKKSGADNVYPFIKNKLGQDSIDQVRSGIVSDLARRARDPSTGRIDFEKLNGVYGPLKQRFQQYFGKDWTDNVDRFITASRAIGRDAIPGAQYEGSTKVGSFVKGFVLGPLDPESRKITYLGKLRKSGYAARLEKAMYNPEDFKQLIKDVETNRPNRAKIGLGVGLATDETYESK